MQEIDQYAMGESAIYREHYLAKIDRHISEMPPLSTTITKVMEICNHPNTSPHDLNRVISLDPVLTGKVLRVVNSTYYSPVTKINSLTRAIIMLGLNTVVNLAASAAILESLATKESFQALPMEKFWTHSICVGVMAKSLAAKIGIPISLQEEYFVAGLLHDLGKIPLNRCFPNEYHQTLVLAQNNGNSLSVSEKAIFDIDHSMVGGKIAQNWQLSQVFQDTLSYHHHPDEAEEENRQLTTVVAAANIIANMLKIGSSGNCHPDKKMLIDLLKRLDVGRSEIKSIHQTVNDEIEKAKVFLQISSNRSFNES